MGCMRLSVLLAFLCLATAALDLDALPHPKTANGVLDPAGLLAAGDRQRCEAACAAVATRGAGELAVVVLPACDGRQPRQTGLMLFNRWGLGSRVRHDGVLLLVAVAERRVEFLLGQGIDDATRTATSQDIVDTVMVPRIRAGALSTAVAEGAEASARRLCHAPDAVPAAAPVEGPEQADPSPPRIVPRQTQEPASCPGGGLWAALVAVLGGATGGAVWWRRRPRVCPTCRVPMLRLEEAADDAHLTPQQRAEETVGSVDYAVWVCSSCRHVEILRHGAWFTRYHACASCGGRTASDRSTVLNQATEMSTGMERIDTHCTFCGAHEVRHRVLPRIQRSSHGSGFRSSSGGGGGGGGRSRGGGGGGGW
jgi:uncharacterized protein